MRISPKNTTLNSQYYINCQILFLLLVQQQANVFDSTQLTASLTSAQLMDPIVGWHILFFPLIIDDIPEHLQNSFGQL
jgi:hypothetical protein